MANSDIPNAANASVPPSPVLTPAQSLEMRVKAAQRAHDDERDFGMAANGAVVKNGEEVIKAAILINGGSCVAMLAFIGTLASQKVISSDQIHGVAAPLMYFGGGVAFAVVAAAIAYFVNLAVVHASTRRLRNYEAPFLIETPASKRAVVTAEILRWIAVLAVAASIALFIFGLVSARSAFKLIAPPPAPLTSR